jgi:hypothetical protein
MSNPLNPYEILKIEDFSSEEIIEAAFHKRLDEFKDIETFTKKQSNLYAMIHDAYNLLSNQNTRKMVDDELRLKSMSLQNIRIAENLSPLDHNNSSSDIHQEIELSHEKNIIIGKKDNKSFFTYILYGVVGILVVIFFLKIINNGKPEDKKQISPNVSNQQKENEIPDPPQPINLIAKATDIQNNILYPDPIVFKQQNLIYAPDGSVFPLHAQLIASLPQTSAGQGSIVIQNPHPTAIFGKLIVRYTESTEPKVIRYFYIPAKETLELFNTPNGTFQIQILTLDKLAAFVSPTFNVPLYSEVRTTQIADWAYPHNPESVF